MWDGPPSTTDSKELEVVRPSKRQYVSVESIQTSLDGREQAPWRTFKFRDGILSDVTVRSAPHAKEVTGSFDLSCTSRAHSGRPSMKTP